MGEEPRETSARLPDRIPQPRELSEHQCVPATPSIHVPFDWNVKGVKGGNEWQVRAARIGEVTCQAARGRRVVKLQSNRGEREGTNRGQGKGTNEERTQWCCVRSNS